MIVITTLTFFFSLKSYIPFYNILSYFLQHTFLHTFVQRSLKIHYYFRHLLQGVYYLFLLLGLIGDTFIFYFSTVLLWFLQNGLSFPLFMRSYYISDDG